MRDARALPVVQAGSGLSGPGCVSCQDDAGAWLAKHFPHLFYIRATGVYGWQPPKNGPYQRKIQNLGPLGTVYPDTKWATEGDT